MDFLNDKLYQKVFKKPKTTINQNLRRQIWEFYIGIGIKQTQCPLCGVCNISNYDVNGGFEACHIIANKFFNGELTKYYLFPGCSICNNECSKMCLLDYMWCRDRIVQLKFLLSKVLNGFINENKNDMEKNIQLGHKIIEHLYGTKRFPAGGGIENTKQIYELARLVHYEECIRYAIELSTKLKENAETLNLLTLSEIKTMQLHI